MGACVRVNLSPISKIAKMEVRHRFKTTSIDIFDSFPTHWTTTFLEKKNAGGKVCKKEEDSLGECCCQEKLIPCRRAFSIWEDVERDGYAAYTASSLDTKSQFFRYFLQGGLK